jgi:hypothetical protein
VRQAVYSNAANDPAVLPDRHTTAPAREYRMAEVADVKAFAGIEGSLTDFPCGFAALYALFVAIVMEESGAASRRANATRSPWTSPNRNHSPFYSA